MSPKRRILVVEDDSGVRDLIRARLHMAGYDVHVARTGSEGLARAFGLRPDAMVLDINLPEMDGFQVLQAMMSERSLAKTPVLILTARHATDDVKRAVTLGAKDYLTKPFSEQQLLARVARLLKPKLEAPKPPADDYFSI